MSENKNLCVVCESGWIIVGVVVRTCAPAGEGLFMTNAYVVRSWRNGKGIGGIAKEENKGEYTLDYIGDVCIYGDKILFTILCEW